MEAIVGHHRHDDAVAAEASAVTQMQRRERQQLVSVDHRPEPVDCEHAIAVSVEGEPDVVPSSRDHLGEGLHVRRTALRVDVAPVRRIGHDGHVRAEPSEGATRYVAPLAQSSSTSSPSRRSSLKRVCSSRR